METIDVAKAFIDLVLKYDWSKDTKLSPSEVKVLFNTVAAAGLEPGKVAFGKLRGEYLEQDGSPNGETFPINGFCPYKVVDKDGEDNYFATGWLDCLLFHAWGHRFSMTGDRWQAVKEVQREIERSIPLEPIQLTPEGDMLREYPPPVHGHSYLVDHTRDNHELHMTAGVHEYCSWIDRRQATKTHDALICRRCHLRVLFPKEVKTYGELRQFLVPKFVQASA